jgi:hypothetical protein
VSAIGTIEPAFAEEPLRYTISGPSVANVERGDDGSYKVHAQESRYWLTSNYSSRADFVPRLVTTTTDWSWDEDEKYAVAVTIDELGGPQPRRIAEFSDPGTTGAVLPGDVYYVTKEPPCCVATGRFHFRSLETGHLLFTSTGYGEVGAATFMFLRPTGAVESSERWVAFEGDTEAHADSTLLGRLRYGDINGVLSDVEVRIKPGTRRRNKADPDLSDDASECALLRWIVPGHPRLPSAPSRPAAGKCDFDGKFDVQPLSEFMSGQPQADVSGFQVELSISGRVYATIPIIHDRLNVAHAKSASRIALTTVAAAH